eukprot:9845712-Alexandrium_andersonii.AAC.1
MRHPSRTRHGGGTPATLVLRRRVAQMPNWNLYITGCPECTPQSAQRSPAQQSAPKGYNRFQQSHAD